MASRRFDSGPQDPSATSDRRMRRQLNGTSCMRYFFAELDRVLLVVVFRAPARRPRGAVVLPVAAALCSFPMSFATVLLRLRRFLRESLRVLSRSLTRSPPPRPSSLRRSLSAPSAASIDLSRRSSARGPRVVVLERDVLLAPVLLLRAVERLAWAILGLSLARLLLPPLSLRRSETNLYACAKRPWYQRRPQPRGSRSPGRMALMIREGELPAAAG
jgi:hypothetical protein